MVRTNSIRSTILLISCVLLSFGFDLSQATAAEPLTGPKTEKRFPPLVVPAGFKATLFACDPLVEYPSVIALGPREKTLFVAHDYMTGLGTEIVRRDEVRLLADTDGDGYADKSTLFAGGFNSIQGLAFHAGTVFVMHAPLLTALRDTNGDGVADERRDLLSGLGLPPEQNDWRLHCANGVVAGHDGWLYLAVGDHGIDVKRPEGDRLVLHGGGILRCRPDGRDLHVFATGLRNIYDIALDEDLNVFVRDNENDGGDYMVRVYHSFFGADHGYPYHYYERPNEGLSPLADLGRGSSAGGVCYLETAFPLEYRGNLFFCEWGRSVVRYERQASGSSFAPMKEHEFAAGAATDPYGFKPTDIIVDRDGSLLVSDWADGQRPKRGRGRIYRIAAIGGARHERAADPRPQPRAAIEPALAQLDSPSSFERVTSQESLERKGQDGDRAIRQVLRKDSLGVLGRMHAVWALVHFAGQQCLDDLFTIAESDPEPRVRLQAIRAIADLCDPTLDSGHPLARTVVADAVLRLSKLDVDRDPRILRETIVALGRLRWTSLPVWLRDHLTNPDAAVAHAAMQSLRRAQNWPDVLLLLDKPNSRPIRQIALAALSEQADPVVVDGLIERLRAERNSERRFELADCLSRVHNKPGPWTYWGYRPAPRPANVAAWERTEAIERALDGVLADSDRDVRTAILGRMQREQIPVRVTTLKRWLEQDRLPDHVKVILASLATASPDESRVLLEDVVRTKGYALGLRRQSLSLLVAKLNAAHEQDLLSLAKQVDDGPVLIELIAEIVKRPKIDSRQFLLSKLDLGDGDVRAAAIEGLGNLNVVDFARRIPEFLNDQDIRVRRAAAAAAGPLGANGAVGELLRSCRADDPSLRRFSLDSLRHLQVPGAVDEAVAALNHPESQLAAINYLAEFGSVNEAGLLAKIASYNRSNDVLRAIVAALVQWETPSGDRDLARRIASVQGESGAVLRWHVIGPIRGNATASLCDELAKREVISTGAKSVLAPGLDLPVELEPIASSQPSPTWLAVSDLALDGATRAQFFASSNCPMHLWVNGHSVFDRESEVAFRPGSDRFEVGLVKGSNRLIIQLPAAKTVKFQLNFRPISSSAEHERLARYALEHNGSLERGRALFLNSEKSLCIKCHRIGEEGNRIGPDLTGVGERFSRIHIIESILEPSRTIAPSYESNVVVLASGRTIIGTKMAEDATTLTLGDGTGQRHEIRKADIEERTVQPRSIMPDGLEKRFSEREFVDLLSFLLGQKKPQSR